ncbi:MAG: aldo/keto reductase [Clostridia bacterium]|nr:aldo/keto reductase [Clostridia bacterium]
MLDNNSPMLGFGLMRLPEKDSSIDTQKVCEMVDKYLASGATYFDTAYVYHGGNSEKVVKDSIVARYPRESFTLATKLPAWEINSLEDRDKVFNTQLERMGVTYIDYYLLHSVEDGNNYTKYEELDCFNWAIEKKAQGLIKYLGFSYHGSPELLVEILDKHPEIEFVQIQLNYADWNSNLIRSREIYNILNDRNIPMIIMEPVKGGILANVAPSIEAEFKNNSEASVASWALRYVGSLPGIKVILSGMSNDEQMDDNLKTFADFKPLSEDEYTVIDKVTEMMNNLDLIPCTACRYCVDGCPSEINIPEIFKALNAKRTFPTDYRPIFVYGGLVDRGSGKASSCLECGQCEGVCPQHLNIMDLLKEAAEKLEK